MDDELDLPTDREIARLPLWARVAFAARCARRALPVFKQSWPAAPEEYLQAVEQAVLVAERAAAAAAADSADLATAAVAAATDARAAAAVAFADNDRADAVADAAIRAAQATQIACADLAHRVERKTDAVTDAAFDAHFARDSGAQAEAAAQAAVVATAPAEHLDTPDTTTSEIIQDFRLLLKKARLGKWTDDTPVPPTAFDTPLVQTEFKYRVPIPAEDPPLRVDDSGTIRVGETRITFDTIVRAFRDGATPEQIVNDFDSLTLEQVYLTVGYYLRHRSKLDAYLAERGRQAEELRQRVEASQRDLPDIRARLLAGRKP